MRKCYKIIFSSVVLIFVISACQKEEFQWNLKKLPEVSQVGIANLDGYNVQLRAELISNGYDTGIERGFCWSESQNPTIEDSLRVNSSGDIGEYFMTIPWTTSESFYVRSFARNSVGVVYSDEVLKIEYPSDGQYLPVVNTINVSNIWFYDARVNAEVLSDAGLPIISKGICLSSESNFNLQNSLVFNSENSDYSISQIISGLDDNQIYYVRAFAENIAGVSYGQILSFTTKKFYEIGEIGPSGGYIFYNTQDTTGGWNFLELHTADIITNIIWANSNEYISTELTIGSGEFNVINIYNQLGETNIYAALFCMNFEHNGLSDWFLPSRDELILVKENLYMNGLGFLTPNSKYWSSSQDNTFSQNAWSVIMTDSQSNQSVSYPKNTSMFVRPIRKF